ncbi:MAG TPA: type II toxin-antitoxin system RelE/ParE family toxin [Brevundimonas sp.]|jgi:toxin ParE1/3/4|uniref:type II toxin-antitoxin system RelE/ParE family toxin n=1 Tax=Brevundimonas sp. TaxID=1871086 RepID=UPI002C89FCA1|nr:type II toxin-antitoxin system RelE/ParE family toxin [Brevundimonas sp.]HRH19895.1 type II toxin-antitoxin system RelE/ParE family toxin [Brevundimonas sp.]
MIKPVRPRTTATADFDDITDYYLAEAGPAIAQRFGSALMAAYQRLEGYPAIGSSLIGEFFSRPGLRSWPVSGFPYLVCYFERLDHVDVVRVLHGARDLGVLLNDLADPEV